LWNDEDKEMVKLRANGEKVVQSIRRDSEEGLLLPAGWELELLTSGSSRQIDISGIIGRYDHRIAITMLSDIILIGGEGKSGSFALADTKQSMLAAALQAQLYNIADVFNKKAVVDLFNINRFEGITGLPKIVPGQIQTPSLKEVALMLRAMGLKINGDMELQNHLRQILGMPQLEEDIFEEAYKGQEEKKTKPGDGDNLDDSAENDFEQNDENYMGGGNDV
jgi:phage gp29-like protein